MRPSPSAPTFSCSRCWIARACAWRYGSAGRATRCLRGRARAPWRLRACARDSWTSRSPSRCRAATWRSAARRPATWSSRVRRAAFIGPQWTSPILAGTKIADTVQLIGARVTFVPMGEGASYSLSEWEVEPGSQGPPVHIHHEHDEGFYVISGHFGFVLDAVTTYGKPCAHV